MIKNRKAVIAFVIALIIFYLVIVIIPAIPTGKTYNHTVFIGSSTKVSVSDNKILVYNEDKEIKKQNVKIYFKNKFIDGYMISDVADSTGVENNYMAFTEQGESILPNNALLAHTKDISISIKPNNRVISSDLSEIYDFAESNSINLSSDIDLYYLYINSLDIDGDNVDEYVYSASLANGLGEYKSFVFLKKDNKYILIDKVESENKGVANTSLIFNNLIDFNNDGKYEFVVGKVMSEYGPDYYELYNLDSEKFTRIGVEE